MVPSDLPCHAAPSNLTNMADRLIDLRERIGVVKLQDGRDLADKLVGARFEGAEGGSVRIAPRVNRQLKVVVRIVGRRVRSEGSRRAVLEALIDGENDDLARAGEDARVQKAGEVGAYADVIGTVPREDLLYAIGCSHNSGSCWDLGAKRTSDRRREQGEPVFAYRV